MTVYHGKESVRKCPFTDREFTISRNTTVYVWQGRYVLPAFARKEGFEVDFENIVPPAEVVNRKRLRDWIYGDQGLAMPAGHADAIRLFLKFGKDLPAGEGEIKLHQK